MSNGLSADAVVTVNDIPDEFREKLANCRIVVTPKVGFDNIDLKSWADLESRFATFLIMEPRKLRIMHLP